MFTKHLDAVLRGKLMKKIGIEHRERRAATASQLTRNSANVDVVTTGSIKTVTCFGQV